MGVFGHCDMLIGKELLDADFSMRRRVVMIQHLSLDLPTIPPDVSAVAVVVVVPSGPITGRMLLYTFSHNIHQSPTLILRV